MLIHTACRYCPFWHFDFAHTKTASPAQARLAVDVLRRENVPRGYSEQVEDTIESVLTFRLGVLDALELEADGCPGSAGLALDEGEASVFGESMPVSFTV